ncbi:hypothetical protein NE237_002101 [Protea cynaroides]|uniref:Uncharacterized protein n=1 Tax=Protea cynaroides TaxID=273540 RepID=A0A9Q0QZ46_9MAGN|nr:hypothetical protein NE237_002101 [Protea cynaroides]
MTEEKRTQEYEKTFFELAHSANMFEVKMKTATWKVQELEDSIPGAVGDASQLTLLGTEDKAIEVLIEGDGTALTLIPSETEIAHESDIVETQKETGEAGRVFEIPPTEVVPIGAAMMSLVTIERSRTSAVWLGSGSGDSGTFTMGLPSAAMCMVGSLEVRWMMLEVPIQKSEPVMFVGRWKPSRFALRRSTMVGGGDLRSLYLGCRQGSGQEEECLDVFLFAAIHAISHVGVCQTVAESILGSSGEQVVGSVVVVADQSVDLVASGHDMMAIGLGLSYGGSMNPLDLRYTQKMETYRRWFKVKRLV